MIKSQRFNQLSHPGTLSTRFLQKVVLQMCSMDNTMCTKLNNISLKFMSTQNIRMLPYLEIESLQVKLSEEEVIRADPSPA